MMMYGKLCEEKFFLFLFFTLETYLFVSVLIEVLFITRLFLRIQQTGNFTEKKKLRSPPISRSLDEYENS